MSDTPKVESWKLCPRCGQSTPKLYGGNGQTLAGCWRCWQELKRDA